MDQKLWLHSCVKSNHQTEKKKNIPREFPIIVKSAFSSFWSSFEIFFFYISLNTSYDKIRYGFILIGFPCNIKFYTKKKYAQQNEIRGKCNAIKAITEFPSVHLLYDILTFYLSLSLSLMCCIMIHETKNHAWRNGWKNSFAQKNYFSIWFSADLIFHHLK